MRFIACILFIGCFHHAAWAKFPENQKKSFASVQRGAKLFINYCSGCHSLNYLTYSRLAQDTGIVNKQGQIDSKLLQNLMFNTKEISNPIRAYLQERDAQKWFGTLPPDLSSIILIQDRNWLYNYLNNFYQDNERPFGVNNKVYPNTLMPNVLEPLFGTYQLQLISKKSSMLKQIRTGSLSPSEQKIFLEDLVNFLSYAAEPEKKVRWHIGKYVLIYLLALFFILFKLKQNIWRKITAHNNDNSP